MNANRELLYQIALTSTPLVGPVLAKNLVSYCGSASAVFESSGSSLLKIPGIGRKIINNLRRTEVLQAADKELDYLIRHNITPLFYTESDYPHRLKHFNDSPALLYYRGTANLNAPRTLAIVGTRKPTPRGIAFCEELIEGLLPYRPLIISGLAYGIDVTAHRKCLRFSLENIAVIGHGHSTVYPAAHRKVAAEIENCGGILTEFSSGTKPDKENFPMRNRIISGMADAVVVIETARSGGSMITAELANQYNKDVFALPGRVQDAKSAGCNQLIKTHKAALIESAADIGYIMRWEKLDSPRTGQIPLFADLSEGEKAIVMLLKERESLGIDQLAYTLQKNPGEMARLLLGLEMKGILRTIPGNRFVLL